MFVRWAGILLSLVACFAGSQARDYGRYKDTPPEIKTWIESLTDAYGVHCCATADGFRPQEVEWDMAGNNYRVKVENTWIVVPESAVIKAPNRIGYAIVWLYGSSDFDGSRIVRVLSAGFHKLTWGIGKIHWRRSARCKSARRHG